MAEQWHDISGYEGLYQVSNLGRVKSLDRVVRHWLDGPKRLKGRILSLLRRGPYLVVGLHKDGIQTTLRIHRLVAAAWIGPCPDKMMVCHGPNGQLDNSVSNLRYDTRKNNGLDRRRDNTHCGRPVRRSDGVEFINISVAAEETGCQREHISKVCRGKAKNVGDYGWEYIDNSSGS